MKNTPLLPILGLVLLVGCDREKNDFASACASKDVSKEECACIYDLAKTELSPSDREDFVATVIKHGDITDMFRGAGAGQSFVKGINLVSFNLKIKQKCVTSD